MGFDLGGLFSMGGGSGGFNTPSNAVSSLSDRSPINIAPVGVNFGAMLAPLGQGSPENGGLGANFMSRYLGGGVSPGTSIAKGTNWPLMLAIPGALVALFFLIR